MHVTCHTHNVCVRSVRLCAHMYNTIPIHWRWVQTSIEKAGQVILHFLSHSIRIKIDVFN